MLCAAKEVLESHQETAAIEKLTNWCGSARVELLVEGLEMANSLRGRVLLFGEGL